MDIIRKFSIQSDKKNHFGELNFPLVGKSLRFLKRGIREGITPQGNYFAPIFAKR